MLLSSVYLHVNVTVMDVKRAFIQTFHWKWTLKRVLPIT